MTTESWRELRRFHFDPRGDHATGAGFRPPWLAAVAAGSTARVTPPTEPAWLHLLAKLAAAEPRSRRAAFREHVVEVLRESRGLPATQEVSESDSLGALGTRFLDSTALTRVLEHQHPAAGSAAHDPTAASAVLEGFLARPEPPLLRVVVEEGLELPPLAGLAVTTVPDPCRTAAELFDREAGELARLVRALRRTRLELAGEYESARHAPWLAQLDWQAFLPAELASLVPVVVVLHADHAAGAGMAALSRLLLSGRPVQVVVLVDPLEQPAAADEPLAGYRFEPGLFALGHREVLVSQISVGVPEHMRQSFARALAATCTALHVVAVSKGGEGETRAAAEIASRAHPLFCYDPQRSRSWTERLELAHNPQPETAWPLYELEIVDQSARRHAFTFADLALLEPAHAHHFLPLSSDLMSEALVPIAEWVRAEAVSSSALPYVWALDAAGSPRRLVVSRPLALACRDRLDFWRLLQQLAGVENESARRAAEAAREEAMLAARAEKERLVAAHAQEIERLQRQAALEVVDRLTAALLEVDVTELVAPVVPGPTPAATVSGFAGQSVDEVTAMLLRWVDPATLDQASTGAGDGRSGQVAAELLRLVGEG